MPAKRENITPTGKKPKDHLGYKWKQYRMGAGVRGLQVTYT